MPELELVIVDLAGTTIEDRGQVPAAITTALAQHGFEVTSEQVKGVRIFQASGFAQLDPGGGRSRARRLKKFMPRSASVGSTNSYKRRIKNQPLHLRVSQLNC